MDVTSILSENGEQLFSTATILKVSTAPSNTYAQHTIEDGTVVADNKIRNQVRISMSIILSGSDYTEVYKDIKNASDNNTKFIIQTRVDSYDNMYIESYPSEESAAIYGTISLNIDFVEQEVGTVTTETLAATDVAQPADVDTTNRGEQLPKDVTDTTTLQDVVSGIKGFF